MNVRMAMRRSTRSLSAESVPMKRSKSEVADGTAQIQSTLNPTYLPTYLPTYIHTYINTYTPICMHPYFFFFFFFFFFVTLDSGPGRPLRLELSNTKVCARVLNTWTCPSDV
jgi:hypothetical protein